MPAVTGRAHQAMWSLRRLVGSLVIAAVMWPSIAHAVVVERIVAVIGEKAILLTEVRARARPYLVRLYAQLPRGPQRAGAESKIMRDILNKMVDEELEQIAANRQSTSVTADEVDRALERIARKAGVPVSKLYEDVRTNAGLSEVEYRQEIRRQVLEGKLLQRLIQNQRVTVAELKAMFDRVREQERQILLYNPAWIVLRLGKDAPAKLRQERLDFAADIAKRVRAGEDFAALAKELSEDPSTSENGGDLGIRVPSTSPRAREGQYKQLAPALEEKALKLNRGEVTDPFVFRDAIVVLSIARRQTSRYESFDAVKGEMIERVQTKKLEKIKAKWLDDLRRRNYVDIRL
ncbi:MAG: peptidylprolyl isomerase [Myxococcota bacterium]